MKVSKRFLERARAGLRKYQRILESAQARDVNESDTAVIVSDFLAEVLGYEKYQEITTEFAIRSTFCDLAIKRDGRVQYLIEVKSVGTSLRESHLSQAISYGAKEGVEWIILTNGAQWQAYRLRFEQPVDADLLFDINLLDPQAKPAGLLEKLYLISSESETRRLDHYWRQKEATSRYVIAQVLLSEAGTAMIRRELRRLFKGIRIAEAEIEALLATEIIKRDALEGERAAAAQKLVRRATRRRQRAKDREEAAEALAPETPATAAPGTHTPPAPAAK